MRPTHNERTERLERLLHWSRTVPRISYAFPPEDGDD